MMNNKLARLYLLGLVTTITLGVTYAYTSISNSLNYLRNEAGDTGHIGYIITNMFGTDDKIDREYLDLPSGLVINDATTSVTGIVMLEANTGATASTTKAATSNIVYQVWNNLNTRINSLVSTALTIETDPVWISASGSYYTKTQVDSNLALKAPIASPTLTGSPKSDEVLNVTDNDSSLATTKFVQDRVSAATASTGGGGSCYYTNSAICIDGYARAPGLYNPYSVNHNICCPLVTGVICSALSPGAGCVGGTIYAGYLNGQHYQTTPGGCDDRATPFCNGGTDTLTKPWNYGNSNLTTTSKTSTTDGAGNTLALATTLDADSSTSGTQPHLAAKYCQDLVYGGYNDWFLPAKDELNLLYTNKSAIGGFITTSYWSSTEYDNSRAWYQDFNTGYQNYYGKNNLLYIRCIRKF